MSKNEEVETFVAKVMMDDMEKCEILQKLRKVVFKIYPKTKERIIYGGIMFSLDGDFGGIFVRKNHVSFEFTDGVSMTDPAKALEGKGKFRRHLKIKILSEIKEKNVEYFVRQVA